MTLAISNRTLLWTVLAIAALALVILAMPSPSGALPDYTSKTGQACGVCHVNPGGGGPQTDKGKAFAAVSDHVANPAGAWAKVSAPAPAPTAAPTAAPAAAPKPAAAPTTAPAAAPKPAATPAQTLPRTGESPSVELLLLGAVVLVAIGWGVRRISLAR